MPAKEAQWRVCPVRTLIARIISDQMLVFIPHGPCWNFVFSQYQTSKFCAIFGQIMQWQAGKEASFPFWVMKYINPNGGIFQGRYVNGEIVGRVLTFALSTDVPLNSLEKHPRKRRVNPMKHLSSTDTGKYHERPFWVAKCQIKNQKPWRNIGKRF